MSDRNTNLRILFFTGVAWCGICTGQFLQAQRTVEQMRPKDPKETDRAKVQAPVIETLPAVESNAPTKTPQEGANTGTNPQHETVKPVSPPVSNTPVSKPPLQETPVAPKPKPPTGPANPTTANTPKEDDRPAFLGVHYEVSRTEVLGSYVTEVEPNTPASTVGIKVGDIIVKADGQPLDELEDLVRVVSTKKVGDKVSLTLNRAGRIITVNPVLTARTKELVTYQYGSSDGVVPLPDGKSVLIMPSDDPTRPFLGLTFRREERIYTVDGEDVIKLPKSREMVVTEVAPGSTAHVIGMQKGDVLTSMNGRTITEFNMIPEMLDKMAIGDEVRITYLRNGRPFTAVGRLRGKPGSGGEIGPAVAANPSTSHNMANRTFDKVFESTGANFKPATVVETNVHPTEVVSVRRASGYDFPSDPALTINDFKMTPLPTPGYYSVSFTIRGKGNTRIYVLDRSGNFVHSEILPSFTGSYSRSFNLPPDERGDFFVEITQNGQSFTRKITLQ